MFNSLGRPIVDFYFKFRSILTILAIVSGLNMETLLLGFFFLVN